MNRAKPPVPKLDDVAQRAGVSTATVSRYYNNPAIVAPATAARIRAAIDEIGYVPNLLAGGLASNRSRWWRCWCPRSRSRSSTTPSRP